MDTIGKEELLCTKYRLVYKFLAALGVKKDEREDLGHEVLLRAYRSLKKLNDSDKLESWLWVICENVVYDHNRKRKKEKTVAVYDENVLELYYAKADTSACSGLMSDLDKVIDEEMISKALGQLEPRTLAIFRFHYYLGYAFKEIAEASGMNYNTVKSLHQRGLRKLEIMLRKRESGKDNG